MLNNFEENENKFYGVLKYIHLFFLSNIYFALSNILLLCAIVFFELSFYNILIYFIPLVLLGPSLSALISLYSKFLYFDKDIVITNTFFQAYKSNFINSLKVWIPSLCILCLITFDFLIVRSNDSLLILSIPLFFLLIIDILFMIYSLIFISKYEITFLNTLKLSLLSITKRPFTSIINFIIILLCIFILIFSKSIISLFIVGFSFFLILKSLKSTFLFIENTYLK